MPSPGIAGHRAKRRKTETEKDTNATLETPNLPSHPIREIIGKDDQEHNVYTLTQIDKSNFLNAIGNDVATQTGLPSVVDSIIQRRLKSNLIESAHSPISSHTDIEAIQPLPIPPQAKSVDEEILISLYATRATPYENSFLSRLHGYRSATIPGLLHVDWETHSPWMLLMADMREHYTLLHPDRDPPDQTLAPIMYAILQAENLPQVHDLLARVFWEGIDVSDILRNEPERCTVVATYKKVVVGVALMSSPQETYLTYLAVRSGWENSQIATTMLYLLTRMNPTKDITLHVSANNSAMLLYNRFGFKAEEFVVGFYDAYLDPQSRASKNAFKLRLRL